jgi:gamma-glutamylcyclotransferase (GGCT)/AIG2-like uncharacterized protein YtfP
MTLARLFVYGTLAPGRSNAEQLSCMQGTWTCARVRGRLFPMGWGASLGYPALVLDASAGMVAGFLFSSKDLPAHWARLDTFEGEGYERVRTQVEREDGTMVEAYVYQLSARDRASLPTDFSTIG